MTLQNRYLSDTTRYSAKEIQSLMNPNTMYLMARNAGPGVDHYFYLYKNDKGEMYSISAFPKNDMSKSPTATAENLANGGGGWGNIVSKVAKYDSKSPDWGKATFVQEFSSSTNNPQETAQAWQKVRRKYEVIQYADKPYLLDRSNSNTAANTVEIDLRAAMKVENVNSQIMRNDIISPGINEYIDTSYSGVKSGGKKVENLKSSDSVKQDISLSANYRRDLENGLGVSSGSDPLVKQTESNSDKWQDLVKNIQIIQAMNDPTRENNRLPVDPVVARIDASTQVLQNLNNNIQPQEEAIKVGKEQSLNTGSAGGYGYG
jgi:hypothetical protein